MIDEAREDIITDCINLICDRFNIPATIRIAPPVRNRIDHNCCFVFLDILSSTNFSIEDKKILQNLISQGIVSRKDYRKLHSLIRMKLINAIHNLRDLTEESLRNLGVKV